MLPTHPTTAPVHGMPLFRIPNFAYTAIFNVLEMAVTSVPTGFGKDGMPLGVQVLHVSTYPCGTTTAVALTAVRFLTSWARSLENTARTS